MSFTVHSATQVVVELNRSSSFIFMFPQLGNPILALSLHPFRKSSLSFSLYDIGLGFWSPKHHRHGYAIRNWHLQDPGLSRSWYFCFAFRITFFYFDLLFIFIFSSLIRVILLSRLHHHDIAQEQQTLGFARRASGSVFDFPPKFSFFCAPIPSI